MKTAPILYIAGPCTLTKVTTIRGAQCSILRHDFHRPPDNHESVTLITDLPVMTAEHWL
jgi:hypothetical protein